MSIFAGEDLACVRAERLVFAGLDFRLQAGGALRVLGPNGSGKSSLLRLMAGLLPPETGALTWDGAPALSDRTTHAERTRYLGHGEAVKPVLSVAENARFWARLHGRGETAGAALEAMGLTDLADLPARFLSAGQRRRLALAGLIASGGRLWLLDEPTLGLDTASVAALEDAIARHRAGGGMAVVATHLPLVLPEAETLDMRDAAEEAADEVAQEAAAP